MAEDRQVGWICTPVPEGPGLRRFDGIPDEVTAFFEVHQALGTRPGSFTADLTADVSASLDLAFLAAESYRADRLIPLRA